MEIMYTRTVPRISRIHRDKIILFYKGCPNPSFPLCTVAATAAPAQVAAALACWQLPLLAIGLVAGGSPLQASCCKRLPPLRAGRSRSCPWPALLPTSAAPYGRRWPPSRAGPGRNLAVGGQPCMGAGRGWSPLLLAAFTTKTQQEHVERLYAIHSHHTQFKTNLSHENLGFDTTVGKPQRVHHMRSENQNKNQFPTQIK
ncbi:hypothetical protein BHM03_00046949 [Ensete ventricosum]|nr:hypothetical protein BHM03_00046949 [Ensete ventricosum]